MKVIAVAASKGGVGKSTLTCAFAVRAQEDGGKVGIIDADPQSSTRDWHELRGSPEWPALMESSVVGEALVEAEEKDCEWVFIDTPPALLGIIEPVIRSSDVVLIPCRPSALDILAIDPVVGLAEQYERPFCFLLSQVPLRSNVGEAAAKQLKTAGRVLNVSIGTRASHVTAMGRGKTAAEIERGDGSARDEIDAAWAAIKRMVKAK